MKNKNDMAVMAQKIDFSGTVCVQVKSESITESYGYANRTDERKNEANTRFGIARVLSFLHQLLFVSL
ncbi:hypothetical protein [Bacillus sp. JCM 19041]|uniref:hypothetical protein n=1 Tax=Bacillus sp. JCM 19041 TaxID=1460637 RepID=UPI000AAE293F